VPPSLRVLDTGHARQDDRRWRRRARERRWQRSRQRSRVTVRRAY